MYVYTCNIHTIHSIQHIRCCQLCIILCVVLYIKSCRSSRALMRSSRRFGARLPGSALFSGCETALRVQHFAEDGQNLARLLHVHLEQIRRLPFNIGKEPWQEACVRMAATFHHSGLINVQSFKRRCRALVWSTQGPDHAWCKTSSIHLMMSTLSQDLQGAPFPHPASFCTTSFSMVEVHASASCHGYQCQNPCRKASYPWLASMLWPRVGSVSQGLVAAGISQLVEHWYRGFSRMLSSFLVLVAGVGDILLCHETSWGRDKIPPLRVGRDARNAVLSIRFKKVQVQGKSAAKPICALHC